MVIAGIKPLNEVKTKFAHKMSGEALIVNGVAADEYYDREQVREILIRFSSKVEAFDEIEPPFIPDVDEFMESDGE